MKVFFKQIVITIMLVMSISIFGCETNNDNYNLRDLSVDMSPRKISMENVNSFTDIVEQVRSAVVGISATSTDSYSVGSGVCVADGGYILTNHHVVAGANSLVIYLADKTQANAETIWLDSALDLAIIKSERSLPYVEFGDSDNAKVGEDVIAIGTPLTLQFKHTVTKGIVSALDRTLEVEGENGASYLQNLIQHDASINPGNSGGALISAEGKLLGINTLKATEAEGIGFAIPIKVGKAIVDKISVDELYEIPYLGVFGFDAIIASYYGKTLNTSGVYVVNLDEKSGSYKAGLQKGDVITKIGDKTVSTMLDLRIGLINYNIGETIKLEIKRNSQIINIEFKATGRP